MRIQFQVTRKDNQPFGFMTLGHFMQEIAPAKSYSFSEKKDKSSWIIRIQDAEKSSEDIQKLIQEDFGDDYIVNATTA